MSRPLANPVVHLELRTTNISRACAFYTELFDWRAESLRAGGGSYLALNLPGSIRGGVVEDERAVAIWRPYVEVPDIRTAVDLAERLGATVTIEPREGPAGWRSVLVAPAGAEVGLWQPKGSGAPDPRVA
ncbi:MAG TPA: VOC family protein [Solirubrobacterales bacterium]|nr:VOC family protein [Solirubrobacterales bacterium]